MKDFLSITLPPMEAPTAITLLEKIELLQIKGGCGDSNDKGDKRRRKTGN